VGIPFRRWTYASLTPVSGRLSPTAQLMRLHGTPTPAPAKLHAEQLAPAAIPA